MKSNVGRSDRILRAAGAAVMAICALMAPLSPGLRAAFGVLAVYMLVTVVAGRCIGYSLMGKSTCRIGAER